MHQKLFLVYPVRKYIFIVNHNSIFHNFDCICLLLLLLLDDRLIDLWSVATSLYEIFTGHVMFPGQSNNEMLKLHQYVKGKCSNKMLRAHFRSYEILQQEPHFDESLRFKSYEQDTVTGRVVLRVIEISQQPIKDLQTALLASKAGADDRRVVVNLADLLEKCLSLDPAKRPSISDILKHNFFALNK